MHSPIQAEREKPRRESRRGFSGKSYAAGAAFFAARLRGRRFAAFLGAAFLAARFFAGRRFAAFLAPAFLAARFFAGRFFAAFLAPAFLAVRFFAAFLGAAFFAVRFFAVRFLAAFFGAAAFLAVRFFAAFLATVLRVVLAATCISCLQGPILHRTLSTKSVTLKFNKFHYLRDFDSCRVALFLKKSGECHH